MKITNELKLNVLELNTDNNLYGRDFLGMFSGIGENNLKKIDDFAGATNKALKIIGEKPSTTYIDCLKSTEGIYTSTVLSIAPDQTDLVKNGLYILKFNYGNETETITVRINDTISKQLKKIAIDGSIKDLSINDIKANYEYFYRYNGQYLILLHSDALSFMGNQIDDFTLKKDIIDEITSDKINQPLSANQGRVLDEKITDTNTKINVVKLELQNKISTLETSVDEEINTTKAEIDKNFNSLNTSLTEKITVVDTKIDTVKTELDTSISNTSTTLTNLITTETDALFNDFSYTYTASTGILSLSMTKKDGTNKTVDIDLPLELIIESGYYDNVNKKIVLVLANADKIEIPVSDLFNEYFADDITLQLYTDTADNNKLKFKIKNGGVSKANLNTDLLTELDKKATTESLTNAINSETEARKASVATKADNMTCKDSILQLSSNGNPIGDPVAITSGGGGGIGAFRLENGNLMFYSAEGGVGNVKIDANGNLIYEY